MMLLQRQQWLPPLLLMLVALSANAITASPCHFYRNKSLGEHQLSLLLSVRDSKMIHLYLTGATLPRVSIPGSLPLLTYMMRASSCKSARLFADGCLLWVLMSGMICHSL